MLCVSRIQVENQEEVARLNAEWEKKMSDAVNELEAERDNLEKSNKEHEKAMAKLRDSMKSLDKQVKQEGFFKQEREKVTITLLMSNVEWV